MDYNNLQSTSPNFLVIAYANDFKWKKTIAGFEWKQLIINFFPYIVYVVDDDDDELQARQTIRATQLQKRKRKSTSLSSSLINGNWLNPPLLHKLKNIANSSATLIFFH